MKRKIVNTICMVMTGCLLFGSLAGCGSSGNGNKDNSEETAAGEEITEEGTGLANQIASVEPTGAAPDSINVGVQDAWETLTPFRTTQSQYSTTVRLMYDRLAYQTADNEFIPQVAKSWEVEEDGITWNVEIYDYVEDSAGNHITADDIVWAIEENMNQALKPCFNKVSSAEKTGDYTFKVVMKEDVVNAFESVLTSTYVVSKKAYEESADGFAASAISTSPYQVTEFVSGSHTTFEKRDNYWQKEELISPALKNNINKVTYTIIKEASQQQVALETGTVDAFESMNATIVPAFEGNDNYSIVQLPSSNGTQLFFSGHESRIIAADENLCKAIAHAIDENGIIAGVYSGYAKPMHDVAVETVVGYLEQWNEEEYFPYDVEKAKEYLEKSNYSGEELELFCMSDSTTQRVAQMIQNYLLAVGINLKLNIVDSALFSASRFDGSQYDMIIVNVGAGSLPGVWGNRFDANAYEMGDGTARKDLELTEMIYSTWTNENFTEENIDKIHQYVKEHAYAYGICLPTVSTVYNNKLAVANYMPTMSGGVDFVASEY